MKRPRHFQFASWLWLSQAPDLPPENPRPPRPRDPAELFRCRAWGWFASAAWFGEKRPVSGQMELF